jgi:hypothetical protein
VAEDLDRPGIESHTLANLRYWLRATRIVEQRLLTLAYRLHGAHAGRLDEKAAFVPDPVDELWLAAYTLALAMRHTATRLRKLIGWAVLPEEAGSSADAFLRAYDTAGLADLRDGFEHSDEYAAGDGKYPDRIGLDRQGWIPGVTWSHSRDESSGSYVDRVRTIRLFGRDYPVDAILRHARDLAAIL